MKIEKFNIYLADLNPRIGTEPGKIRPVVVVQTDLLNGIHPSTIICPLTTKVTKDANVLRVHVSTMEAGLTAESDILVDQIRAIDNRRFKKHAGKLSQAQQDKLLDNLRILIIE
jgi:mRNA interferase MazF